MKSIAASAAAVLLSIALSISPSALALSYWPAMKPVSKVKECQITIDDHSFSLSASDLERRLGLSSGELLGLTITAVPDRAMGIFTIDGQEVKTYTSFSRAEINRVIYTPLAVDATIRLSFIPKGSGVIAATLAITHAETLGSPPTLIVTNLPGLKSMPVHGSILAQDPDGEKVTIQLVKAPKYGEVAFEGTQFVYTPFSARTGTDSFSICAVDSSGNYSAESLVQLTTEGYKKSCFFSDISSSPFSYFIVRCAEAGLLRGEQIGKTKLFSPDGQVNNGELLVMLLTACGLDKNIPATASTQLINDDRIPQWIKPYLKRAIEKKIIVGESFDCTHIPTRAEAVSMVDRATGISGNAIYPLHLADAESIPAWAAGSYRNLFAHQLIESDGGNAYPDRPLDRQYAAVLVWHLYRYCKAK